MLRGDVVSTGGAVLLLRISQRHFRSTQSALIMFELSSRTLRPYADLNGAARCE